jgi:hypothetical protein
MKHAMRKKTAQAVMSVIILSLSLSPFLSCKKDISGTDLVAITGVNTFITDQEVARGTTKTLETTIRVKMHHQLHENADVSCVTCHHKKQNDERIKKCSYCHKGLEGAKMFHLFCIKCHNEKQKGPVKCNECHIEKEEKQVYKDIEKMYGKTFTFDKRKHAIHSEASVECNVCHHDAGKEKNKKKCTECHIGKSKMIILHYFCKDCHKKQRGPVTCQECHVGVKADYQSVKDIIPLEKTGHRLPQIRFNHKAHVEQYNTECIDCHHMGSMKKCSACHTNKDVGAVINLKAAFHQQCHECHRRTSGPQGCHQCHREQR